ncbi:MAG TPA: hypothetical protein VGL51_11215 [Solirubrobacteraceae bacterium]|jgi:hypothetical protein
MSTSLPSEPAAVERAHAAAQRLEHWGDRRGWAGADPYDGLNARRLAAAMRGSPLALRLLTQVVKRSPVNLRPMLGIPAGLSAATLAQVISAYARNGFLPPSEAAPKLRRCIEELQRLRCARYSEPCWGYHFDVQTRVFFYPRTDPNTIATAFAGLALLDAHDLAGDERAAELALGVGEFFVRHVPQTETGQGAFFGYLEGDRTPIHNASMLICALLARLGRLYGRDEFTAAVAAGLRYTVDRQRPDGSWPYGELPHLDWVDGFHTGYVLDSLLTCVQAGIGGSDAERAWRRGLRFYAERLIDPDGATRYQPDSLYPVDGQCVAQAIQTLSRAATLEPELADKRWLVLDYAESRLMRRDGAYAFQRERFWLNRTAHPRWVQAPMLSALTHLLASVSQTA